MLQRTVESFVVKRMGNTFGPPKSKRMTIFVDDINAPRRTAWGDQTTSEILRQLIETKGFYSVEKPGDFCSIHDTQVDLYSAAFLYRSLQRKIVRFRSVAFLTL